MSYTKGVYSVYHGTPIEIVWYTMVFIYHWGSAQHDSLRMEKQCFHGDIRTICRIRLGVQNRLTAVSVNQKSVNRFFGLRKIQTVTELKILVNRFSVRPKPEP